MARKPKQQSRSKSAKQSPREQPQRGRGRPSDFKPEYCDDVVRLGTEGKSKAQMARALGVARQTLDNWADARPEFLDALTRARDLSLAWWEEQLERGIWAGKEFNANAFAFAMKNRFPDDYRDKHDHEHAGKGGGPIILYADDAGL